MGPVIIGAGPIIPAELADPVDDYRTLKYYRTEAATTDNRSRNFFSWPVVPFAAVDAGYYRTWYRYRAVCGAVIPAFFASQGDNAILWYTGP